MNHENQDERYHIADEAIYDAFFLVLGDKDIDKITVSDVIKKAGIVRSTFYNHYQDVYDLLEQIENEMLGELNEHLKSISPENDLMSMSLFEGIFRFLTGNSDICVIMLGENGDKRFLFRMLEMGKENCVKNYLQSFPRASREQIEDFYAFVSNGCLGLMTSWIYTGMKKSPDELAATAKAIMTSALKYFDSL